MIKYALKRRSTGMYLACGMGPSIMDSLKIDAEHLHDSEEAVKRHMSWMLSYAKTPDVGPKIHLVAGEVFEIVSVAVTYHAITSEIINLKSLTS